MSDLFENHIVGFPTRRLICTDYKHSLNLVLYTQRNQRIHHKTKLFNSIKKEGERKKGLPKLILKNGSRKQYLGHEKIKYGFSNV